MWIGSSEGTWEASNLKEQVAIGSEVRDEGQGWCQRDQVPVSENTAPYQ